MAEIRHACEGGLTPECFEEHPQYAKKVFAYRLMHTLCLACKTRRLRKSLWKALTEYPLSWMPPENFILPPGKIWEEVIPDDWTPKDPLPDGVTIDPAFRIEIPQLKQMHIFIEPGKTWEEVFPDGWKPTVPLPDGASQTPYYMPPAFDPADEKLIEPITPEQELKEIVDKYGVDTPLYLWPKKPKPQYNPPAAEQGNIRVKLYRGDGTLLTGYYGYGGPGDLLILLYLSNSEGQWVSTTVSYDSETNYWTFVVDNEEDVDPNGYFVTYYCLHGLYTQYPYRYRTADKLKNADLVKDGDIVDIIPYAHVSSGMTPNEGTCYATMASWNNDGERWTTNKLSIKYDIIYTINARSASAGPDWVSSSCMGIDWVLEAPNQDFGPIQNGWEWSDIVTTTTDHAPTVEIPTAIAEEIATILGGGTSPDWAAFNAQFSSIAIGNGGIGQRKHIAYALRSGSANKIRTTAWKELETKY